MIVCKDRQPAGQGPLIQDLFAMLFRVDIAMATTEVTLSKYVKKEIARIGLELDCSAFYLHKLISCLKCPVMTAQVYIYTKGCSSNRIVPDQKKTS